MLFFVALACATGVIWGGGGLGRARQARDTRLQIKARLSPTNSQQCRRIFLGERQLLVYVHNTVATIIHFIFEEYLGE